MVGVSDERILPRRHEVAVGPLLEVIEPESIGLHIPLIGKVNHIRGYLIGVEGLISYRCPSTGIQPLMRPCIPYLMPEINVLCTHQTIRRI